MAESLTGKCIADMVSAVLRYHDVDRVFGLCGGHIMPLWIAVHAAGIRIIDVRDERAAVHMAQAHAELTGQLGVALVTAGPGVTHAITGIANAQISRAPVPVLSGTVPSAQTNKGALQELKQSDLVRSITTYASTVDDPSTALYQLQKAIAHALGAIGEPGCAFLDIRADLWRAQFSQDLAATHIRHKPPQVSLNKDAISEAADILLSARRPLVISGRGARGGREALLRFLDRWDVAYIDTGETKGLVPPTHQAFVGAMRTRAMSEADVVVTVGRRLDFQLAYGSPAIFRDAQFIRIAEIPSELRDNRRGLVEILGGPAEALDAIVESAGNRAATRDAQWLDVLRQEHQARSAQLKQAMAKAPPGSDGRMHPYRLLATIQDQMPSNAVLVVDGGDFLSFARIALSAPTVLDPGPFGCLGIGVPYGIAASLVYPDRPIFVASGDGAFGFNAIELDTAVRHGARVVFIVANNGAWQIEVHDQMVRFGKTIGTRLQFSDYAAIGRAFGMYAERVEDARELPRALARAVAERPALLDVVVTPQAVSPDAKSGLASVPDLHALATWDQAERAWRERAARISLEG